MKKLFFIFLLGFILFSCWEQKNADESQAVGTNQISDTDVQPKDTAKADNNPKTIKTILNLHPVETFHISSQTDTIITGKKGVVIYIPGNAFDIKNNSNDITIQLEEYLSIGEMFLAGLTTSSNGQVLETNGIVNIRAIADNKEIKLKPNINIVIHFPKKKSVKKMDLVRGVAARNGVYWLKDTTNQLSLKLTGMQYFWQNIPSLKDTSKYKNLINYLKPELKLAFKSFDEKTKQLCNNKSITFDFRVNKNGKAETIKINKSPYENLKIKKLLDYQPIDISEDFEKKITAVFTENLPLMEYNSGDKPIQFSVKPAYFELPVYSNDKDYMNAFEKKYANNKPFSAKDNEKEYSIFCCSKLGWINCGRYPDIKTPKANLVVTVDPRYKTEVKVVMSDFKGIAGYSSLKENIFSFNNIPSKQKIKILAIQYREDRTYIAIKESNTSNQTESDFDHKAMTSDELKGAIETLH